MIWASFSSCLVHILNLGTTNLLFHHSLQSFWTVFFFNLIIDLMRHNFCLLISAMIVNSFAKLYMNDKKMMIGFVLYEFFIAIVILGTSVAY